MKGVELEHRILEAAKRRRFYLEKRAVEWGIPTVVTALGAYALKASGIGDPATFVTLGPLALVVARYAGCAYSPDSKILAIVGEAKVVHLWDLTSGPLRSAGELAGHTGIAIRVAFSPDGQLLASVGQDDTVRLWRLSDGQQLSVINRPLGAMPHVAFSPGGRLLASSGPNQSIDLWQINRR